MILDSSSLENLPEAEAAGLNISTTDIFSSATAVMAENHIKDFLYYGRTSLDKKEIPRLGSGKKILSELDQLVEKNEYLSTPLKGLDYNAKNLLYNQ